ncbi:MAG: DegT/DnrJ/EryC1/StrS family aminotransferase [Planctomycetes bacterium]|nr:DegT/DnrJ/EryC1/StrS family aminotransferase [Planctomycetota bacterium]
MSGWLTQGPKVAAFEAAFRERHGVAHALATTSCTTALHLALAALEIGPGDEVIVPAFTWVATANVVILTGATPVFVDIDPHTFNMDAEQLATRITERTRAIIAVHLFGLCADMDRILAIAGAIPVIEDAACAAGGAIGERHAGSMGVAGAFSFHPRKSITTGEGGMVTTNDAAFADRANMLRNHGASVPEEVRHSGPRPHLLPDFDVPGFNYRMTDLQAAVGIVQLGKLDRFLDERRRWADFYERELAGISWLRTPRTPAGYTHAWQAYVCFVDEDAAPMTRNTLMDRLQDQGISTRPGTHAVHMLGYYRERFGLKPDDFPAARDCDRCSVAIPLHNRMTSDDFARVVAALRAIDRAAGAP